LGLVSRSSARRWVASVVVLVVAGLTGSGPTGAFQAPNRFEPRLPGAVTHPPEGIGPGAPFDMAAFFAAPPPELNAAPLYLDALFEFGFEMAVCFPEGADTTRRKQVAERRSRAIDGLFVAFIKDPTSVSGEAIDALVAELEPALQKVEGAQRRPRCVFELPLDMYAPLPHVIPTRRVARLVTLKTLRYLDRGDAEQPLHDLEVVLRLARDLRPRGSLICQIVATSIGETATDEIVPALLASPAFRDEHAQRLLDLLVRHEAAPVDGYQEGTRLEYIMLRKSLAVIAKDPRQLGKALGNPDPPTGKTDENVDNLARDLELQIKASPTAIAKANARIDEYFHDLLTFDRPVTEWPEKLHPKRIRDGGPYARVAEILLAANGQGLAHLQARSVLGPRAARCLVALKLWKSRSKELPTDLEAVVKAAGMARVPVDPYSGKPLRMAIIGGEPVIYSIGGDGRDDGGQIDSNNDHRLGDRTFRLPATVRRKA
jgi:hypothetical protein